MKGNERIIEHLNKRLAEELTAVNQYFLHAEMCENWGYERLHAIMRKRSIDEMKHAEQLIARILFLDGRPIVSNYNAMSIGDDVPRMIQNDRDMEEGAIRGYNESIRLAVEVGDNGSRELLEKLLAEEEAHIDLLEAQLDEIAQMGAQNFLVCNVKD